MKNATSSTSFHVPLFFLRAGGFASGWLSFTIVCLFLSVVCCCSFHMMCALSLIAKYIAVSKNISYLPMAATQPSLNISLCQKIFFVIMAATVILLNKSLCQKRISTTRPERGGVLGGSEVDCSCLFCCFFFSK